MEVEFISGDIIKIQKKNLEIMKNAHKNVVSKFRYCFHESENAGMQEMLFVQGKGVYGKPHKHIKFAETQVLVEGEGVAVTFDETGEIEECFKISMNDYRVWRFNKNVYHMIVPLSEEIIIFEAREGQFVPGCNFFPDWAPNEEKEIEGLYNTILKKLEEE